MKIIPEKKQVRFIYNQIGESPKGCKFKVGDYVQQVSGNMRPYGKIIKILDAPDEGIF
jgi:CxxC motif-containing protein